MINYPSTVSRTLDPSSRGLCTIIGQHDRNLSDADLNLIQDLQDWKRAQLVSHTAPSGCLSVPSFVFYHNTPNTFIVPSFDVLFRGEVIQVRGHNTSSGSDNRITLPAPASGLQPGQVYVVFLELWYCSLDPSTGKGYYTQGTQRFFYPYGCVSALGAALAQFPDDVIDPSFNKVTSERTQIQWRLSAQPVPVGYDFSRYRYGLDPDPTAMAQVYGQGSNSAKTSQGFSPLLGVTGEATLWRAGGDAIDALGSMDGYSYATPVALLFQRTTGIYDPDTAPFGCAGAQGGGLFSSHLSGRFDARFADIVYSDDAVDTRLSTSLTGYDLDLLMARGTRDIFTGSCRSSLTRSDQPSGAIGALLTQLSGVAPLATASAWQNIKAVGSFDEILCNGAEAGGIRNGLSTDQRTYFTTLQVAQPSGGWAPVTVTLPASAPAGTVISSIFVQYPNSVGHISPLMGTQLSTSGIGTRSALITPTVYPPSGNPLLVTVGVTYPAATGVDLQKVSTGPVFGQLTDPESGSGGSTLPLYGASDYSSSEAITVMSDATKVKVYAPNYSSSIFGVRVHVTVPNTSAATGSVAGTVVFTISRVGMDGRFTGLYITQALTATGDSLQVLSRELAGNSLVITLQGPLDLTSSTELVVLCHRTAQAAINPAVRGVVAIEEVILIGNGNISIVPTTTSDLAAAQDRRVSLLTPVYTPGVGTVITGFVRGGQLRGVSGNDTGDQTGLIWVMQGSSDQFVPTQCSISISVASFTLTVPDTNLVNAAWFVAASFLPALAGSAVAIFSMSYVPYQGEGRTDRSYQVLVTAEDGLVTTNGTGAAPIPGVKDVFPYDRKVPIATTLPTLSTWSDTDLDNDALGSSATTNYDTKRAHNTETTFTSPLRTNDFVPPLQGSIRRLVQLAQSTGKGFGQITPHIGFAIDAPTAKTDLGLSYVTEAPVTLYVDNVAGSADNDGLTPETPLRTLRCALDRLPPILLHPVSILLQGNASKPYALADLAQADFAYSALDGGIYCLGNIALSMQGAGCITVGSTVVPAAGVDPVVFDGAGVTGNNSSWSGSAAFTAFVVSSGRVIFDHVSFTAPGNLLPFWTTYGAVRVERAEVQFKGCKLIHPQLGVTAAAGSEVGMADCSYTLGPTELGVLGSESTISIQNPTMVVANPDGTAASSMSMTFFSVVSGGSLTLATDDGPSETTEGAANPTQETGFPGRPGPFPTVAQADMGSTILANPDFFTQGQAVLNGQSVLQVQSVSKSVASALDRTQLIALQTQFVTVLADTDSAVVGRFS